MSAPAVPHCGFVLQCSVDVTYNVKVGCASHAVVGTFVARGYIRNDITNEGGAHTAAATAEIDTEPHTLSTVHVVTTYFPLTDNTSIISAQLKAS